MLNNITFFINWGLLIAFSLCFFYQAVFFFAKLKRWKPQSIQHDDHRFAVLVAARNEENVIGHLIDSIFSQTYDIDKISVFVVADNCSDNTASVARAHGAMCYERKNSENKGKGYALAFLLDCLERSEQIGQFDGYFIFDADNILSHNFIREMNSVFSEGYTIVSGYRNSTNISSSWISFGYGLWFLHESSFLNRGRMMIGSNCMISGTGYLIRADFLKENNGWNWFFLTEDVQITADCFCKDIRIGYCETAIFYDEQPVDLKTSFTQRIRWVRGYYQVFHHYGRKLFLKTIHDFSLSCFDMLMSYLPAFILVLSAGFAYGILLLIGLLTTVNLAFLIFSLLRFIGSSYLAIFVLGLYTAHTEQKQINCNSRRQLLYLLLFPFYMFTYFPIALIALFSKAEWIPIPHGSSPKNKKRL